MFYKGRDADPQQIGREPGVKAVLSGRIVQVADRFRIAVELADAVDGSQLWGSQFTRPPSDLLLVEEEIASEITEAHASLAYVKLRFDWEWEVAEREFRAALTRARELDPLSPSVQSSIGRVLHFEGRYDEAIAVFTRVLQTDPPFAPSRMDLADLCQRRAGHPASPVPRTLPAGSAAIWVVDRVGVDIRRRHRVGNDRAGLAGR